MYSSHVCKERSFPEAFGVILYIIHAIVVIVRSLCSLVHWQPWIKHLYCSWYIVYIQDFRCGLLQSTKSGGEKEHECYWFEKLSDKEKVGQVALRRVCVCVTVA